MKRIEKPVIPMIMLCTAFTLPVSNTVKSIVFFSVVIGAGIFGFWYMFEMMKNLSTGMKIERSRKERESQITIIQAPGQAIINDLRPGVGTYGFQKREQTVVHKSTQIHANMNTDCS